MDTKENKILVIDDEEPWCLVIRDILNKQGYHFVDCKSKVTQFSDLKGYDLAILDIRMPKYDGFQLKTYLNLHSPNTKVVFISQFEDFGLDLLTKASGADGWVEKKTIMENDIDFILLIEELLKELISQTPQEKSLNIPSNIVSNELNLHGIKTIEQIKLREKLVSLKKSISVCDVGNKSDLLKDVDQISIELSKKIRNNALILEILENIRSTFAGHEIGIINIVYGAIDELLTSLNGLDSPEIYLATAKTKPSNNKITKIEVNPQFNIRSDIQSLLPAQADSDVAQLVNHFSQLKDLIVKALPSTSGELELIENSLRSIKFEDDNQERNSKAIKKITKFIKQLGDDKSEVSKIIKGADKGKDLANKLIESFFKISNYLQIDAIKDILL